jgi:hypothetical protein
MTKILYITSESEDYLQDQVLLGLKQIDGITCVDYPKKDVLYENCPVPNSEIYGNSFTIWKEVKENSKSNRKNIYTRLYNGEFEFLIFGSIHRQKGDLQKIELSAINCPVIFLDGEDMRYPYTFQGVLRYLFEWINRRQRGMSGRPEHGSEVFNSALENNGYYFKREKTDITSKSNNIHPISFSIPEQKIRDSQPQKTQLFQTHVQCSVAYELNEVEDNCTNEPIFESESNYYEDISASKYGITMKKGGWECMRHYEIAANWTVPCFYNLLQKPSECAPHGLRDLENCIVFSDARELKQKIEYVERNGIYEILQENAVKWVKKNTCRRKAQYVLDIAGG